MWNAFFVRSECVRIRPLLLMSAYAFDCPSSAVALHLLRTPLTLSTHWRTSARASCPSAWHAFIWLIIAPRIIQTPFAVNSPCNELKRSMSLWIPFSLNWAKYFPIHNVRCVQSLENGNGSFTVCSRFTAQSMRYCIQNHIKTPWKWHIFGTFSALKPLLSARACNGV